MNESKVQKGWFVYIYQNSNDREETKQTNFVLFCEQGGFLPICRQVHNSYPP